VATAALSAVLLLAPAGAATAEPATIASPKAGKTVKGMLLIKPRVKARRGPYRITIKIDGQRYDRQDSATRKIAASGVPIDTTELKNGRHRLSIEIRSASAPWKLASSIVFKVRNQTRGPAGAGRRAPSGDLKNLKLLVSENFDKDAPTGSFDPDSVSWDTPSYVGSSGTPWIAYPSRYLDTFLRHPYRAKEVLSVHHNVLDYHLRPVDGRTAGASLSPVLPGGKQYQSYGRYEVRMRIGSRKPLSLYHMAFLLWPEHNRYWEFSESDYPETQLTGGRKEITGYSHFDYYSTQEVVNTRPIDLRAWHTFAQEWTPKARRYYLDGKLIHTTKHPVWGGPMRWELQVQTFKQNGKQRGHLYVDWAAVWGYSPGTRGT
jgi:hypothetical protein